MDASPFLQITELLSFINSGTLICTTFALISAIYYQKASFWSLVDSACIISNYLLILIEKQNSI